MLGTTFRAAVAATLALGIGCGVAAAASPDDLAGADSGLVAAMPYKARIQKLGLNKSIVVDLQRDARDVLVSNPDIADAVIRTPRRIYLTGVKVGQTDVIIFDRAGAQIVSLELQVERGTNQIAPILNRLIPGSMISVEVVNDNMVLSGSVRTAADAAKAIEIADAFANGGAASGPQQTMNVAQTTPATTVDANGVVTGTTTQSNVQIVPTSKVINLLAIEGEDQVQLKVSIAEVQRSLVKQLGIDWNASNVSIGGILFSAITNLPFAVKGTGPSSVISGDHVTTFATHPPGSAVGDPGVYAQSRLGASLKALEQSGLYRTLAEPTLTAISGESANFLAGGEFPVPVGRDSQGNVSIAYKPFGVALTFSPVVMSEGRISLRVKTEVSELSQEGAIQIADISLPSLKVRRAETTLELPSGGSMVLGGLLQDNVKQSIAGLPGLKSLPILGTLFRSRDFLRDETELVIIVTPYIVKPVARNALARPDAGFSTPDDLSSNFLGKLNRVYGAQGKVAPDGTYQGGVGYIIE
ncbi:MAG: type II and III secretion system protein family protein [Bauldia sp.]